MFLATSPLLRRVTLSGAEAVLTWGWHTAAVFRTWRITKDPNRPAWVLHGTVTRADRFKLQQRPLYFNAPRKGGYWCWPVVAVSLGRDDVTAQLGQPEQ